MTDVVLERDFEEFVQLGRLASEASRRWLDRPGSRRFDESLSSHEQGLVTSGLQARRLIVERLRDPRSELEFTSILEGIVHSRSVRLARLATVTCEASDPVRRVRGLQALSYTSATAFRSQLVRALADPSEVVRSVALGGLKHARRKRTDPAERAALMALVRNQEEKLLHRIDALQILGLRGGRLYARFLEEILCSDPSPELREEATACLKEERARVWRVRVRDHKPTTKMP